MNVTELKRQRTKLRKLRAKYYINTQANEKIIFSLEQRIELLNQQISLVEPSTGKEKIGDIQL